MAQSNNLCTCGWRFVSFNQVIALLLKSIVCFQRGYSVVLITDWSCYRTHIWFPTSTWQTIVHISISRVCDITFYLSWSPAIHLLNMCISWQNTYKQNRGKLLNITVHIVTLHKSHYLQAEKWVGFMRFSPISCTNWVSRKPILLGIHCFQYTNVALTILTR